MSQVRVPTPRRPDLPRPPGAKPTSGHRDVGPSGPGPGTLGTAALALLLLTGAAEPLGQWVWTPADLAPLREAGAARPGLRAAAWIGTLSWEGRVTSRLGNSPAAALREDPAAAVVVRLDDRLHAAWAALDDAALAAQLAPRLRALLEAARAAGAAGEVQLDYDCPERLLPRYAALVRALAAPGGPLAGREVWVTSLLAHARRPDYGALFRGAVAGHVLQLFDAGPVALSADDLRALLERQGLPYRLGVGAFERGRGGVAQTDHRAAFALAHALAGAPGYRGAWIFPAGRPWLSLWEASR